MRKVFVHLTGGLGNQLFQYAAGLSLTSENNSELIIEQELGKPRGSAPKKAEILSFQLPQSTGTVKPFRFLPKSIMSKVVGYALRTGVDPSQIESTRLARKAINLSSAILISVYSRTPVRLQTGQGVGYSNLDKNYKNIYLVGYFQSYKYAQAKKEILHEITVEPAGPELEYLTNQSLAETPLVVHLRFGDYLKEKDFGIPSSQYYAKAISEIQSRRKFGSIWVFSDDLRMAKEKLKLDNEVPIRWINSVDNSVVSTIQAMRLGYGYVIANSSFSWWAAFLTQHIEAEVIAPKPWFMNLASPSELIPPNWSEIDAGFSPNH